MGCAHTHTRCEDKVSKGNAFADTAAKKLLLPLETDIHTLEQIDETILADMQNASTDKGKN